MPSGRSPVPLEDADEISTTAGGVMPASRLGARILGNDRPGPISARLRETFWEKRRGGLARDAYRLRRGRVTGFFKGLVLERRHSGG